MHQQIISRVVSLHLFISIFKNLASLYELNLVTSNYLLISFSSEYSSYHHLITLQIFLLRCLFLCHTSMIHFQFFFSFRVFFLKLIYNIPMQQLVKKSNRFDQILKLHLRLILLFYG